MPGIEIGVELGADDAHQGLSSLGHGEAVVRLRYQSVLIVDDEVFMQSLLRDLLEARGIPVRLTRDTDVALLNPRINVNNDGVADFGDEAQALVTVPVGDGARWAVAGDRAAWRPDGTIGLHGRESVTTNTGRETVLAEEGRKPESVFDFVQGITAVARDKPYQDARLELEAKAKKLLDRVD